MTTNPFIESYVANSHYQVLLKRYAHKILIIGLFDSSKPVREEQFVEARMYCKTNHITFKLEEFNSGIEEDREMVVKLPAFHLYLDTEYEMTFYLDQPFSTVLQGFIVKQFDLRSNPKRSSWLFTFPKLSFPIFRFKKKLASSSES
jgi:hypothetical protein